MRRTARFLVLIEGWAAHELSHQCIRTQDQLKLVSISRIWTQRHLQALELQEALDRGAMLTLHGQEKPTWLRNVVDRPLQAHLATIPPRQAHLEKRA